MIRLVRVPVPEELKERKREILGEVKNDTMYGCRYNELLYRDKKIEPFEYDKVAKLVPSFVKDYQIEDLCKSLKLQSVFNINKPGYGKTLETILWIKLTLKQNFKALVLCPKSVIETWRSQLKRYWKDYEQCGSWMITNYEQLISKKNYESLVGTHWDVIVLDESHRIKSMKSKTTKAVFQLKGTYKHCLTGTPIKNRPEDLASQLKWLDNFSITNYTDFQFAFCDMQRDHWGWHAKGLTKNKTMVENLQKLLDLYCIGDDPNRRQSSLEPEHIKVRLNLDKKVKDLYKKVEGEYDKELRQRVIDTEGLLQSGIKVSSAIESAIRRQQLASNPQLFDSQLKNVKFDWILDWLDGTDEKVVIFSKYAKTIEKLDELLTTSKIKHWSIYQKQSSKERKEAITKWQENGQVLIGTFGVLGEGVDGLQTCCHYEIFIDREWTSSDNEQAEGRIVRTGQKEKPIIYILQAIGTIDIQIERVQLDKGHDVEELLGHIGDEE